MDAAGNLYGTTSRGGSGDGGVWGIGYCGTVFKVDTFGDLTVLHNFVCAGGHPYGALVMDAWGNLYGTTWVGPDHSLRGAVFKLDTSDNNFTYLPWMGPPTQIEQPFARLTMAASGDLYGAQPTMDLSGNAGGIVFKLAKPEPSVTFTGAPASATYGYQFNVYAVGDASTTAAITASGPCSVSGTIVTMTGGTGTCVLTADWAADSTYKAARLTQTTAALPVSLTITADSKTKVLNAPNPVFTANYSGFVPGDGPGSLGGTLNCTSPASATSPVGSYSITCSGLTSTNYSITYLPGTLTILYAPAGLACGGDVGHTILPPINANGTSVWKQGATIAAKFRVCDANGVSIGAAGVVSNFALTRAVAGTGTNVEEPVTATNADAGFRWDSTAQQWIFNISTKGLAAGNTYVYIIKLNDGTSIGFQFGLK